MSTRAGVKKVHWDNNTNSPINNNRNVHKDMGLFIAAFRQEILILDDWELDFIPTSYVSNVMESTMLYKGIKICTVVGKNEKVFVLSSLPAIPPSYYDRVVIEMQDIEHIKSHYNAAVMFEKDEIAEYRELLRRIIYFFKEKVVYPIKHGGSKSFDVMCSVIGYDKALQSVRIYKDKVRKLKEVRLNRKDELHYSKPNSGHTASDIEMAEAIDSITESTKRRHLIDPESFGGNKECSVYRSRKAREHLADKLGYGITGKENELKIKEGVKRWKPKNLF